MKPTYQFTTDIMEEQFGPVKLRIIYQTGTKRIARIAAHNGTKPLELALVTFHPSALHEHESVHEQIVSGALLGKTLRSSGIPITRRELAHFIFNDDSLHAGFPGQSSAVVKVAELLVGDTKAVYTHIIEFYSPDVLWYQPEFGGKEYVSAAVGAWQQIKQSLLTSGEKRV